MAKNRPSIDREKRERVYARDGWRCLNCGQDSRGELTLDHIVPYSRGGTDEDSNLQTLCRTCNVMRGDTGMAIPFPAGRPVYAKRPLTKRERKQRHAEHATGPGTYYTCEICRPLLWPRHRCTDCNRLSVVAVWPKDVKAGPPGWYACSWHIAQWRTSEYRIDPTTPLEW